MLLIFIHFVHDAQSKAKSVEAVCCAVLCYAVRQSTVFDFAATATVASSRSSKRCAADQEQFLLLLRLRLSKMLAATALAFVKLPKLSIPEALRC